MRSSNNTHHHPPSNPDTNLQRQLLVYPRYHDQSFSPYSSKHNFHIRENIPTHHSGPQLTKQSHSKLQNQRHKHVSVLLYPQQPTKLQIHQQTTQHLDSTVAQNVQMTAFQRKKRARLTFLKKQEAYDQSYKIGVLTNTGIECQPTRDKQTEQTEPTNTCKLNQPTPQVPMVEEMHYEMVRAQQKARKVAKN